MPYGAAVSATSTLARHSSVELVADPPVGPLDNPGACTLDPPNWDLIASNSLNHYEFCNNSSARNWVWIDVHQKPTTAGKLGGLKQSIEGTCTTWQTLLKQSKKGWLLFCND